MSDQNLMLSDSLNELSKLIDLMEEDADNLTAQQAIGDYIAPVLGSLLAEIEANRQYVLQAADRANLAILMNEKTFLGEILTSIAEHFATIIEELPQDTDPDSKLGVAASEIQDLLATWMSFDIEDDEDDEEFEDGEGLEDAEGLEDDEHDQMILEEAYQEGIGESEEANLAEGSVAFEILKEKIEAAEADRETQEVLEGEVLDAKS